MREISGFIHDGAMAYLSRQYKALIIFVVIVCVILGVAIDYKTAICFLAGAIFSVLAGYIGMQAATKANVRTANTEKKALLLPRIDLDKKNDPAIANIELIIVPVFKDF